MCKKRWRELRGNLHFVLEMWMGSYIHIITIEITIKVQRSVNLYKNVIKEARIRIGWFKFTTD